MKTTITSIAVVLAITASIICFGQGNTWKLDANNNVGANSKIGSSNNADLKMVTRDTVRQTITKEGNVIMEKNLEVKGKIETTLLRADSINIPGVITVTDTVVQFQQNVQIQGQIVVDSAFVKGPLVIGDGTFSIIDNVFVPGPNIFVDQIRSDNGRIAIMEGTTTSVSSNILLGIGTQTPNAKLHVFDGDINVSGSTSTTFNRGYRINGFNAIRFPANSQSNLAVGDSAGSYLTGGFDNTLVGYRAGRGVVGSQTFSFNTCVGALAGLDLTSGSFNTYIGVEAGRLNGTGSSNTMVGFGSGKSNNSGSNNTYLGVNTANGNYFVGNRNTILGVNAGLTANPVYTYSYASDNIFIGYNAGRMTDPSSSAVNNGNRNIFIGLNAGQFTGPATLTATDNVLLGANTSLASPTLTNAIAIGANTIVTTPNTLLLGNGASVGINLSGAAPTTTLDVNGNANIRTVAQDVSASLNQVLVRDPANNGLILWRDAGTMGGGAAICGTGIATNFIPKWTGTNFCQSQIFDDGTRVGINTITPVAKVDMVSTTELIGLNVQNQFSSGSLITYGTKTEVTGTNDDNYAGWFKASGTATSNIGVYSEVSNCANGMGIGAYVSGSSITTGGRFSAQGGSLFNNGLIVQCGGTANANRGIFVNAAGSSLQNTGIRTTASGGTTNYAIFADQGLCWRNSAPTSWDGPSDIRLKENITAFTDGLSVINQINPVKFNFNGKAGTNPNGQHISVIAQDIQQAAPYTVFAYHAKLDSTDATTTELLGFNPGSLLYVAINAIKEQQQTIQSLQSAVGSLQSIVSECCSTNTKTNESGQTATQAIKLTLPDAPILGDARPNPNTGSTEIPYYIPEISLPNGEGRGGATIIFTDILGRIMEERELGAGYGLLSIDTQELPNGSYFYTLIINGNKIDSKTMVKTK